MVEILELVQVKVGPLDYMSTRDAAYIQKHLPAEYKKYVDLLKDIQDSQKNLRIHYVGFPPYKEQSINISQFDLVDGMKAQDLIVRLKTFMDAESEEVFLEFGRGDDEGNEPPQLYLRKATSNIHFEKQVETYNKKVVKHNKISVGINLQIDEAQHLLDLFQKKIEALYV